jgi:hypothetical protein
MPRNSSGVYSLPQAPFTPGTVISSSAVNSDFSDIATALTGSVACDGSAQITGILKGTITTGPIYSAASDNTTGFGIGAVGEADIYSSGTKIVVVTATGVAITGNASVSGNQTIGGNLTVTGAVSAGSIAFTGTAAVQIPAGTTGQRPSPVTGQIRYNSSLGNFEGYDGTEWDPMSQVNQLYSLSSSVNAGILTVNFLNALTGAAPTAADPVSFSYQNGQGGLNTAKISATLSINTNGIGATLGSSNNVPFRFWIVLFSSSSSGNPVLGLINCSVATATSASIFQLLESLGYSAVAMSNAATSAGVFYCPNGITVTGQPFKILGFLEYSNGLATAGNYTSTPNTMTVFNAGAKKPGDVIQAIYASNATPASTSSGTPQTFLSQAITPSSKANLIFVNAGACGFNGATSGLLCSMQMFRGATAIGVAQNAGNRSGGAIGSEGGAAFPILDAPGSNSSVTYALKYNSSNGANSVTLDSALMTLQEIMG